MYNETPKLAFMPAEMRVHVINAHVDEVSLQQSRDYGRGAERCGEGAAERGQLGWLVSRRRFLGHREGIAVGAG